MNEHKKVRIWFQESGDNKKAPAIWINEVGSPDSKWFYMPEEDGSQMLYDLVRPYMNNGFEIVFENPNGNVVIPTDKR